MFPWFRWLVSAGGFAGVLVALDATAWTQTLALEEHDMNAWKSLRPYANPTAVGVLGLSLIGAHALAPDAYSWSANTISDLGAQGYERAWMMRAGFVSFGALISLSSGLDLAHKERHWAQAIPLVVYGISMIATGIFSAAPFVEGVSHSEAEANLHGVFATLAGISLSASMLGSAIVGDGNHKRWFHGGALVLTTLTSAMFLADPEQSGVWQRVLWGIGLGWVGVSGTF